jgi:hypothetical protein
MRPQMSNDIPEFPTVVEQMQTFLKREGHSTKLCWVFREDLWRVGVNSVKVCQPCPQQNESLAAKVFEEGRAKGLVEIKALATLAGTTVATVWFPKHEEEEVQGWNVGLKLSILSPLPRAKAVASILWPLIKSFPSYRRYQALESAVGSRAWALG